MECSSNEEARTPPYKATQLVSILLSFVSVDKFNMGKDAVIN